MTRFGSSTMLSGGPGAGVLDADYEAFCGTARWELQYWWPQRVWRWVKTARLEWGRCQPADPEQALTPDRTLFPRGTSPAPKPHGPRGGYRPAAMEALNARRVAVGHATDGYVYEALAALGPSTVPELCEATRLIPMTVGNSLKRRADLFERVGKRGHAYLWQVVGNGG